jgi:hypothetical protein
MDPSIKASMNKAPKLVFSKLLFMRMTIWQYLGEKLCTECIIWQFSNLSFNVESKGAALNYEGSIV